MKRFTIKNLINLTPADLVKMDEKSVKDTLSKARKKFDRRQKSFYSARNKNVFSPALDSVEKYYEDVPRKNLDTMNRNQALSELFKIQDFFSSKTSSVKEARKANRIEDERLFGKGKTGRPRRRLNRVERADFWMFYEEYNKIYKTDEYRYGSSRIQMVLGNMIEGKLGKDFYFDMTDFKNLHRTMQIIEENDYGPNIFSGRGND